MGCRLSIATLRSKKPSAWRGIRCPRAVPSRVKALSTSAWGMNARNTHCPCTSCRPRNPNGLGCRPLTMASTSAESACQSSLVTRILPRQQPSTDRPLRPNKNTQQARWRSSAGAHCKLSSRRHRHAPDILGILPDCAVGREEPDPGRIADRHGVPLRLVPPDGINFVLRLGIGVEIPGHHEPVVLVKPADQVTIAVWIVR